MKEKIIKFFLNLQFIVRPDFWYMANRYSEHWDKTLNNLMDNVKAEISEPNSLDGEIYTIRFDKVEVWIQNYPYSYGHIYDRGKSDTLKVRPSRLTIKRLNRFVEIELMKKSQESINKKLKWANLR